MTKVSSEYERYQASSIMKKLAALAHGENYCGQTSSATYSEIEIQIQKMVLPSKSRILDAGCGSGAFTLSFSSKSPFYFEGVDLSEQLIQEATAKAAAMRLTHCSFSVADFTTLSNYSDSSFDLILCIGSLYWGQPLDTTLATWRRITTSSGQLLLFLNLLYQPLSKEEEKALGATQFIPAFSLEKELVNEGWVISEWIDQTDTYQKWLKRWCAAMQDMSSEIQVEMGQEAAFQLIDRFTTYHRLAKTGSVRRIILRTVRC
jgi:ubiquinone/menaquinone biosynthesis C-methylase UbiE